MVRFLLITLVLGSFLVTSNYPVFASDPTRIPDFQKTAKQSSHVIKKVKQSLTAIFIKQQIAYAIIGDKMYRKGDYYRDQRLVNVSLNRVTLKTNNGFRYLTLNKNIKR